MNFSSVEKIAAAILYEGYILYPYRKTAIKNRQRWNFGTLYPREYAEAQRPAEPCRLQAEFLLEVEENAAPLLNVRVNFLQLVQESQNDAQALTDPSLAWEQAVERTVDVADLQLETLKSEGLRRPLVLDASNMPQGAPAAAAHFRLEGELVLRVEHVAEKLWKLRLELRNNTLLPSGAMAKREEALPRSFVSAHVLLGARAAQFVSLLDPPECYRDAAADCNQIGVFPVLAGEEPARDILFCSPIILYDYPKVAAESEGDFFDGTEMDEMLALRVMTLSDAEKQEMREGDPRARKILERTEALTPEAMLKAHGVIRNLRAVAPQLEDQP